MGSGSKGVRAQGYWISGSVSIYADLPDLVLCILNVNVMHTHIGLYRFICEIILQLYL